MPLEQAPGQSDADCWRTVWQAARPFLAEDSGVQRTFADKRMRYLRADPARRPGQPWADECGSGGGVDEAMAAKIRNASVLCRPLRKVDGAEIRFSGLIPQPGINCDPISAKSDYSYRGDNRRLQAEVDIAVLVADVRTMVRWVGEHCVRVFRLTHARRGVRSRVRQPVIEA